MGKGNHVYAVRAENGQTIGIYRDDSTAAARLASLREAYPGIGALEVLEIHGERATYEESGSWIRANVLDAR